MYVSVHTCTHVYTYMRIPHTAMKHCRCTLGAKKHGCALGITLKMWQNHQVYSCENQTACI